MPDVKAIESITHSGTRYSPGEVVKGISKEEAERLHKMGAASFLDVYAAEAPQEKESDNNEELRDSLDQYTLKELRDFSEVYGINLDSKANKKTVIDTIIESGKSDMFFEG